MGSIPTSSKLLQGLVFLDQDPQSCCGLKVVALGNGDSEGAWRRRAESELTGGISRPGQNRACSNTIGHIKKDALFKSSLSCLNSALLQWCTNAMRHAEISRRLRA